jgi:hypothetical protein
VRALWLADEMRSWGLDVVEVAGWQARGKDNLDPKVVVCHHTASRRTAGDMPSLEVLIKCRSDVVGPLSQVGLARSGKVYVIASGTSNNAGTGGWQGVTGNRHTFGIEAENDGVGEPWPQVQVDAYHRIVAGLCRRGLIPVGMVCGHKEWTTRKIDPAGIDMDEFRAAVTQLLNPPEEHPFMALTDAEQEELLVRVTRCDGELDEVLKNQAALAKSVAELAAAVSGITTQVVGPDAKGVKLTQWQRDNLECKCKDA